MQGSVVSEVPHTQWGGPWNIPLKDKGELTTAHSQSSAHVASGYHYRTLKRQTTSITAGSSLDSAALELLTSPPGKPSVYSQVPQAEKRPISQINLTMKNTRPDGPSQRQKLLCDEAASYTDNLL